MRARSARSTSLRPRIVFTTVHPDTQGGVAAYTAAVAPHLSSEVRFVYVGRRPGELKRSPLATVKRLATDYFGFVRVLPGAGAVHLNPSLNLKALVRDLAFLVLAKLRRIPTVVLIHGWDEGCERFLGRRLPNLIFRWTYLRADHVLVLSQDFATRLRRLGRRSDVDVTITAVGDDFFRAVATRERRVAEPREEAVLLFLARLEESKGCLTAVDTTIALRRRGVAVRLVVAGDGPAMPSVRARALSHPDTPIDLVGYVRDQEKVDVFRRADAFLYPTVYGEGMSICVLEAMAAGLPVVTRPVGGVGDFFEDPAMGRITTSEDPEVFADLVESLLMDRTTMTAIGKHNADYAASRFSGKRAAAQLDQVYSTASHAR